MAPPTPHLSSQVRVNEDSYMFKLRSDRVGLEAGPGGGAWSSCGGGVLLRDLQLLQLLQQLLLLLHLLQLRKNKHTADHLYWLLISSLISVDDEKRMGSPGSSAGLFQTPAAPSAPRWPSVSGRHRDVAETVTNHSTEHT